MTCPLAAYDAQRAADSERAAQEQSCIAAEAENTIRALEREKQEARSRVTPLISATFSRKQIAASKEEVEKLCKELTLRMQEVLLHLALVVELVSLN